MDGGFQSSTDTLSAFNDVLVGAEVYKMLDLGLEDMATPEDKDLLLEIADFTNKFEDGASMLKRVLHKKPFGESSLKYATKYIKMQYERVELKKRLSSLEDEISMFE